MSDPDYSPGAWVVIAGARSWLFADVRPSDPVVARCWDLIRDGADVERVLGAIADEGLRAVRSFAAVQHERGACRVIVRGAARVNVLDMSGETCELGAEGVATWLDRTVDGPVAELRLTGDGPVEPLRMPLAIGVALASFVRITVAPRSSPAEPRVVEPVEPLESGVVEAVVVPVVAPQRVASTEPGVPERFDHLFGPSLLWQAEPPLSPEVSGATLLPPSDEGSGAAPAPPLTTGSVGTGGASAATGADTTGDHGAGAGVPSQWQPPSHQPTSPWHVDESGIIQAISFSDRPLPAPAPAASGPAASAPASPAPPQVADEIPQDALATRLRSGGPTVPAVRCTVGHLNPPHADTCRACGAAVPGQEPVLIARPALGVLRLATGGEPISLDRAVILGRAPDPAAGTGQGRANAIRVDSPGRDVSRSHAEFRPDGWQLVVTDLGSSNGTTVAQPSAPPFRLEPRGSAVVEPGAVVTLADEVSFRYEVGP